ncbi:hypothetical protein M407DRAFT_15008 [Tulasnella calospora MUT 4182]|uniref:BHLH domain-containing protein n=1 Tax=Tulasnella calospora MUT 4182 TaxID=1051891 RepID=A0A0C3Q9P1_9AGAM|nr:hypothetical protein M407DRAFT_15008 [Tulasnella calospora MUT 4182]
MPAAEVADVLLTPSESNALSSFLSVVDRLDPNTPQFLSPEWNMYAATLSNQVHLQEGREDLARATKDLISSGFGTGEAAGSLHAVTPHLYNPAQNRGAHGGHAFGSSGRKLSSATAGDGTQLPHSFLQNARSWPSSLSASRRNTTTASPRSSSGSGPTPPPESSSSAAAKPQQLLTAEQKKLNHIHSEQKRRANIRRGYDALCDVVPALREAIRAEDAECANTGKKRGRGKLLGEDGEKMDGRAGPRSESVVLQKTIEHIDELMAQRSAYLERLRAAKAALPSGHPALSGASQGEQPWEKIWNGGIGLPLGSDPMDPDGDPMDQDEYDNDGGSDEDN